jgi:hypothetical protein
MKHYLNFIKTIGVIEISEPFGFDGSTHKVEQGENYGRDVILGDEEIELTLTESHFEPLDYSQQLPNGVEFQYASHAFEYLKDVLKNEGWESEIEYILEKDNIQFSKGIIDGLTAVIEYEQIKFKVIQNTKREEVKRRMDVVINAFSDEDLDGNAIEPCQTTDILLRAKPIIQDSEWDNSFSLPKLDMFKFPLTESEQRTAFNTINSVINYGIENTLSFLFQTQTIFNNLDYENISDYGYISAQNNLDTKILIKDIKIVIDDVIRNIEGSPIPLNTFPPNCSLKFYYMKGDVFDYDEKILIEQSNIPLGAISFTYELPEYEIQTLLYLNEKIYIWFEFYPDYVNFSDFTDVYRLSVPSGKIKATATSTSIDSIIKGVRYIDLLKHACLSVGLPEVICPEYDLSGEHYNNFAFNGYLIGQITDKPFNNKLKDILAVTKELNHGYQINPENIEVLHHDEFYKNTEIGAFIQIPNLVNKTEMNTDLAVKTFDFNYKNSSKGRETNRENSIDDVHGQTQWLYPSKKTDTNLKIELDHIRSAFLIEEQRRKGTDNENTTSLEGDDKLYLLKVISIPPSQKGGFTANLLMQIQSDPFPALKIASNNFRWDLLGINIFTVFKITAGENVATYAINQIEPSVLTLTSTAFFSPNPPDFNGFATITFEFNYTDVVLMNQTNEGYSLIEGVANGENYSNLEYSIKRNLNRFYSMLGACGRYLSGLIKNTMFEVNGNLITRKTAESNNVIDSESIDLTEIKELRLYEPRIESISVFSDFETATDLFNKVATDKGYIRVQKVDNTVISGYPKEMEYKWLDGSLEMKLLPIKESEFYDIDINLVSSFQINNNLFVSLYDVNDIMIVTPLRFDKIRINGVIYTDEIEFAEALTNLIQS